MSVGFLTIAQNGDVDYLRLAYAQAMSIKLTMPNIEYAVLVDDKTEPSITDQHRRVFDHVIKIEEDHAKDDEWKLANEWQVYNLTPFTETIKVESDILFTREIDHWLPTFRLRDVVLSLGCKDYRGRMGESRRYRKLFDDNELPDVYNGLMYFRRSETAWNFFNIAKKLYANWPMLRDEILINCRYEEASTDVIYALATKIIGDEKCTLPGCDFINFTHMKNDMNKWPEGSGWNDLVVTELDLPMIRVNNVNQYHPLHYQVKSFVTDDLIREYEQCLQI